MALAYPNRYFLGMSNLGFQTLYALLNRIDAVACERVFLPEDDQTPLKTIESGWRLHDADCIAFSISFEQDYLHLLRILEKADIPLPASERDESHPLIIAGGAACLINPEPIAPFIDAFLIGEAEAMRLSEFFEVLAEYHEDRNQCLEMLARQFPFVYVPALEKHPVQRVFAEDISQYLTTTTLLSRDTAFDNTFLIETGRGCSHGCRFCAAGYVYRPPRFRNLDALIQAMDIGVSMSSHIGLVGAAVSDLPDIRELCHHVRDKDIRVSFSSLRADALSPELLSVLKQSRVRTATIAPEAGSERLRRVINKGISEENILNAADLLVSEGIPNLKLYFMIGLPTENEDDINEIVHLCKRIKERFLAASRIKRRIGEITVSLNCFVPKPFTPFQWAAMNDIPMLKHKIEIVRKGLKRVANLKVQADDPRHAPVQAILSRGDKTISDLLLKVHKNDGNWLKILKETDLSETDVYRERASEEIFPWEFIRDTVDKSFLRKEYERAMNGKSSPVCPMLPESCGLCGVCRNI